MELCGVKKGKETMKTMGRWDAPTLKREAGRYALLLAGAAILSFGLYNVHSQSRITEGGVLGMTLFLQHTLGISPAISEVVLDVICYVLGVRFLGTAFLRYALTATCGFAGFYALHERMGYVLPVMHPLVAAVVGALFVGVGVGLVVRVGGACGGDDALALVISKVSRWPVERAYLLTDVTVLLLSLSYIPVGSIACSLLTVTLSSAIIGKLQTVGKGAQ